VPLTLYFFPSTLGAQVAVNNVAFEEKQSNKLQTTSTFEVILSNVTVCV